MDSLAPSGLADALLARERGQWDRALELLRRWGRYFSPALLSHFRGAIWDEAGDPETAVIFYGHAADLEPENGNNLATFLYTLDRVQPAEAQRRAGDLLSRDGAYPAVAIIAAVDIALRAILAIPEAEAVAECRRLIPMLERASARVSVGEEGGLDRLTYAMAAHLLAFSHEFLGEYQAALQYYSQGLQVDPNNLALLTARGLLLYGVSPRAISDFELAIGLGCLLAWPHILLAHHYLISERFEECRRMSERALQIQAPDAIRSELAEWGAISQAELGFPPELVRAAFEDALRIDPANDRARRNLAAFEEAIRSVRPRLWETPAAAVVRASGLAARRLARVA